LLRIEIFQLQKGKNSYTLTNSVWFKAVIQINNAYFALCSYVSMFEQITRILFYLVSPSIAIEASGPIAL
jgi:hypothetical protein